MSTINVTNLSGRGGATPNLPDGANITGVATATTFSGTLDGSLKSTGTPTLGLGVTINASGISVSGVLTATTFKGDGTNLTGVGESIAPWHYNPDVNDTLATVATGIGITFNKKVVAGSGTATLKVVNAGTAGTTIQSWGVSSCTFNVTQFSLGALVSDLTVRQTYQVDIPSGFLVDSGGTEYVGTSYTFTAQDAQGKYWVLGGEQVAGNAGPAGLTPSGQFSSPVQIWGSVEDWSKLASTSSAAGTNIHHQLSITKDGKLWAWGSNGVGQLGLNNEISRSSPTQVGSDTTWGTVSKGYYCTLATKTDGTLWTWGNNTYGQLGQNTGAPVKQSSPVQLPGTTWSYVAGGYYTNAAIKTDGTLWTWGRNFIGVLGHNNAHPVMYSSPVQVPGTTWSKVTFHHEDGASAVKTDGTLWAWGVNNTGRLGLNDLTWRSSPTQIPGTTWTTKIDQGHTHMMCIKTDGTLWAVGENEFGQSAQNDIVRRSSPVQIPGTWSSIDIGKQSSFGYKTDGTMWSWGYNPYGSLGQNDVAHRSSPVQVPGTTWVAGSGAGNSFHAVLKTDGTLWSWGLNQTGSLGHNNRTNYSSPVQVPGTNWNIVAPKATGYWIMAHKEV